VLFCAVVQVKIRGRKNRKIVRCVQLALDGWKKLCLNSNMDTSEDPIPTRKLRNPYEEVFEGDLP